VARWRRAGQQQADQPGLKLYYAGDFHGVQAIWRKFLRAGKFYDAQALIMGGDLGGKAIVPIELKDNDRFEATFLGERYSGTVGSDLDDLKSAVAFNGFYSVVAPAVELDRYRDSAGARAELFEQVMVDELGEWVRLAEVSIDESGIPVYVQAGNDDPEAFDIAFSKSEHLIKAESGITRVGDHEMISCSYSNPTPWHSPRELPEDDLYERLRILAEKLEDPSRAIFNFHVPPFDTGIDTAYKVNDDLTLATRRGQPIDTPVGSQAVRRIIEEYQPLLSVHGHIHESRGVARIGRTVCLNPGSIYNSGRIQGVLVTLGTDEVLKHQFVVG
jgi:uncharacterized protein